MISPRFSRQSLVTIGFASVLTFACSQKNTASPSADAVRESALLSQNSGGVDTGGGDTCENQIKVIRADLQNWVKSSGPNSLSLPRQMTAKLYVSSMLKAMGAASVKCVGPGDTKYPIQIDGTPKVCRFDRSVSQTAITCDYQKFMEATAANQYQLIHHEYAGLAGVESPNGADSDYSVSNQLSAFRQTVFTTKLAAHRQLGSFSETDETRKVLVSAEDVSCVESRQNPYTLTIKNPFASSRVMPVIEFKTASCFADLLTQPREIVVHERMKEFFVTPHYGDDAIFYGKNRCISKKIGVHAVQASDNPGLGAAFSGSDKSAKLFQQPAQNQSCEVEAVGQYDDIGHIASCKGLQYLGEYSDDPFLTLATCTFNSYKPLESDISANFGFQFAEGERIRNFRCEGDERIPFYDSNLRRMTGGFECKPDPRR